MNIAILLLVLVNLAGLGYLLYRYRIDQKYVEQAVAQGLTGVVGLDRRAVSIHKSIESAWAKLEEVLQYTQLLIGRVDAVADKANESLLRLATVAANVQTLRPDLVRIDLNAKEANEELKRVREVLALFPAAMTEVKGAVVEAIHKMEEASVPPETQASHAGAFARVNRVRDEMRQREEASWNEFVASLNKES